MFLLFLIYVPSHGKTRNKSPEGHFELYTDSESAFKHVLDNDV